MLRPGSILDGKYEILALIGTGGMSRVWLARDRRAGKQWAVKEISKTNPKYKLTVNEQKTLSEIEIMRKLDNPALPRIVDVLDEEETLYVVMDYIEGNTLLDILENYGVQKEEVVVTWMLEVCDILTYLHSLDPPIIYRDIKPSNLMVNREGHIKIIDFGIAREYKGGKGDTMPLGTEGYASPEHFSRHTDERSDIYTVGATAYHLLTGKDPQDPPYTIQPIRSINPALSQGLEKIIMKATRQDPDERYQTAKELANAFTSYKQLDDVYIDSLRSRVNAYRLKIILAASCALLGIILTVTGFVLDRHNYNSIVESPGGTIEAKEENLARAVSIKPKEKEAYLALIKAYAEDGMFTEEESARFFAVYNEHQSQVPDDVNYELGEAYLRYYTGTTDGSARAKLLTAEPFFSAVKGGDNYDMAQSYIYLADCYRNYVMSDDSLLTKDVTKEDLEELLSSGTEAVTNASNSKLRQITAEAVLNLIEQEKLELRDNGVALDSVRESIDTIRKDADAETVKLADETEESVTKAYANGKKKEKSDA